MTNEDLNTEQVIALLDAYATFAKWAASPALFIHEHKSMTALAACVRQWADTNKLAIDAHLNHAHGRTYESWDISVANGAIHFFPTEVGLLADREDLKTKIERIRKEADDRVRELCAQEGKLR